ncbi:MAG: ethanolamine utilization protein EutN [Planctomycetota bacterium]|jgi:ethanolamine utilization protein EutN
MFLADVIGTVVSPVQHASLDGRTLLLLRPLDAHGHATGKTRIGVDRAQAGVGDRVIVVDEGNSGRQLLGVENAPIKTIVVGVVDYIELEGEHVYDSRGQTTTGSKS